ncbi:MAG: AI-2E family transporter [Anaerolineae bacterium]|nr:AI-2E family transporter [Anaerolineae bacterium]
MMTKPAIQLPPLNVSRIAMATLIAVAIAAAFWLLFRFRIVVLIFFFGLFISTTIRPAVAWLFRRGVPRWAGIIVVYAAFLLLIVAMALLGAPLLAEQTTRFAAAVPEMYEQLRETLIRDGVGPIFRIVLRLPQQLPLFGSSETAEQEALPMLARAMDNLALAARVVLGVIATFLIAFYWTLDGERVKRSVLLLSSPEKRESHRELINELEARLGAYTAGVLILMAIVGVMSYIAYLLIGLPYALFLALVAGLLEGVPTIGPTLAAVPATLVAFSISPVHALWVIIASIVIQQVENAVLFPRVMKSAVGVHPVVTLLAFFGFTVLFGVAGALVAIPLAATISAIFSYFVLAPQNAVTIEPGGRDRLSVLRYETQQLLADVSQRGREEPGDGELDDERAAVRDNLERLVAELEAFLGRYRNGENGEEEQK